MDSTARFNARKGLASKTGPSSRSRRETGTTAARAGITNAVRNALQSPTRDGERPETGPFALLRSLSDTRLEELARRIRSGALAAPANAARLASIVPPAEAARLARELEALARLGLDRPALARIVTWIAGGGPARPRGDLGFSWDGRGEGRAGVARELVLTSASSVMVAGLDVERDGALLEALARRLERSPEIDTLLLVVNPRGAYPGQRDPAPLDGLPGVSRPLTVVDAGTVAEEAHRDGGECVVVVDHARALVTWPRLEALGDEGLLIRDPARALALETALRELAAAPCFRRAIA